MRAVTPRGDQHHVKSCRVRQSDLHLRSKNSYFLITEKARMSALKNELVRWKRFAGFLEHSIGPRNQCLSVPIRNGPTPTLTGT
jgi:hypothetical protein